MSGDLQRDNSKELQRTPTPTPTPKHVAEYELALAWEKLVKDEERTTRKDYR